MGCSSCGGNKPSGKPGGRSQMPKNWGGMKSSGSGKAGKGASYGGSFGTPKVRGNFGRRSS